MLYEGGLYTFFDPSDKAKSMVVGISLDVDEQLYVALHVDGSPYLRNAVYGKRYGKHQGDETAGKPDKRSFMYLTRQSALELYDLLGGIFSDENAKESSPEGVDMEHPLNAPELTIDDMLRGLD